MDKVAVLERLRQSLEYLKDNGKARNQAEIADLTGILQPHISSALKGDSKRLSKNFIHKFATAYSDYINEDWLLTGEGRMEAVDKSLKPHYPASVSAGVLSGEITNVKDTDVEYEPIIKRMPQYDYTIDVRGHSMEPTYSDNGIVACRKLYNKEDIKPGRAYVIATKEGAVLKRIVSQTLNSIRVVSDNPDPKYKPYSIDKDLILSIDEVVGSVNVGNPEKGFIGHISKKRLDYFYEILNKSIEDREKFEENMKDIIRNLASGVYSDNK